MPEVPGAPPSPRAALFWDGDQWRYSLVDNDGHLQLDVLTSGLPAGAATAAAQALALAQLQLIEDMRDALQSVATDRLIVRGEDQLFSLQEELNERVVLTVHAGGTQTLTSGTPGAGEYWIITAMAGVNETGPCTSASLMTQRAGMGYLLRSDGALLAFEGCTWSGWIVLNPDESLQAVFRGTAANNVLVFGYHGFVMTLET